MKKKYLAAAALLAALALTPTMNSFAASGWASENGNWVYYDNATRAGFRPRTATTTWIPRAVSC